MEQIIIEDLKYEDIEECYKLTMNVFNENNNLGNIKQLYNKIS